MEIETFEHSFHLTGDRLAGDFGFEGGLNRWGVLVCVSNNPCLRGGGIACLEFREFHGVLGFGNYNEVKVE